MDQFNKDTYKKDTLFQEFYHSCLGKIIILAVLALILFVIAVLTIPSNKKMMTSAMDNIHECLQDNDSIVGDNLDEGFANIPRTFSEADTLLTKADVLKSFRKYNSIEIYDHTSYKTVYLHNARHPQGVRIAVGIFGMVISTIYFDDLVLDIAPVHGDYNKKLISTPIGDEGLGENPHLKPYHYRGNPDD